MCVRRAVHSTCLDLGHFTPVSSPAPFSLANNDDNDDYDNDNNNDSNEYSLSSNDKRQQCVVLEALRNALL